MGPANFAAQRSHPAIWWVYRPTAAGAILRAACFSMSFVIMHHLGSWCADRRGLPLLRSHRAGPPQQPRLLRAGLCERHLCPEVPRPRMQRVSVRCRLCSASSMCTSMSPVSSMSWLLCDRCASAAFLQHSCEHKCLMPSTPGCCMSMALKIRVPGSRWLMQLVRLQVTLGATARGDAAAAVIPQRSAISLLVRRYQRSASCTISSRQPGQPRHGR